MPKANMPSQVTVTMAAQNNSNERGTAVLSQTDKGLVVTLSLTPAPSAAQPAHIHEGTCAKLNPAPAYPLKNVTAGTTQSGSAAGTSTTTLTNVTLDKLTKGDYAINVHKSASDLKTYVSCGDIKLANPSGTTQ
ncbi:MAG: CHRD domain-containing protein [Candidatus Eremiobacteraeota bacterium]|nr:CHRD domain-containing protein [Candidatus Eremiobacteraeota bacterium]